MTTMLHFLHWFDQLLCGVFFPHDFQRLKAGPTCVHCGKVKREYGKEE